MPTRTKSEAGTRPDAEIALEVIRRMKEDIEVPDDRITIKVLMALLRLRGS